MRRPDYTRRVAVTGLGVISPIGQDIDDRLVRTWSTAARASAHHPLRPDALRGTGRRRGQRLRRPNDWMDFKDVRRTDRNVVLGVASAKQALADSGPRDHATRTATTSASSSAPAAAGHS